jgi:iron complex outermembrane recepter protein
MMRGETDMLANEMRAKSALFLVMSAGVALHAAAATAAEASASTGTPDPLAEIIVTGTLIRGVAPTGSELTTFTSADFTNLGIRDTTDLLTSIPQDGYFNNPPQVGNFGQYQTIIKPSLRYLGGGSAGGSSTLVLLDGARMPGMGIFQTTPDMDAIAPGSIERVEILTGGGSATYGSDAVGGVVNLITHKRFDGLEVGGHYGGAIGYKQWDADITAGKTWSNGSVWISYDYSRHDALQGSDRNYVKNWDYINNVPADLTCTPANVTKAGVTYALPGLTPGLGNRCDILGREGSFYPGGDRHSVFTGFNLNITDTIDFDMRAYYMQRKSENIASPLYSSLTLAPIPGSAYIFGLPGGFGTETASFNFSSVFGPHANAETTNKAWGITPTLTFKLGHDWEATAFFNYGVGKAEFETPFLDGTALQTAALFGGFNPFNLSAPGNASQLAYQAAFRNFAQSQDNIYNSRVVFDGPLFTLPGGDVRAAAGAEFMKEEYTLTNGTAEASNLSSIPTNSNSRNINSAFTEFVVPIVGKNNAMAGLYSLVASASARYDHYSDFGGTTNPKFGLTWHPIESWSVRGNWGKSYQAPSLSETVSANPATLQVVPIVAFPDPFCAPTATVSCATAGRSQLILYPGGGTNLQPEKATTYEFGTDFKPAFVPGLSALLTYYHVDFSGQIGAPPFYSPNIFYGQFPNNFILSPTPAQIQALAKLSSNPSSATPYIACAATTSPNCVYSIADARDLNLSSVITSGLDFGLNYQHAVSFGTVFGGVNGTYVLSFKQQALPGAPTFDNTDNNTRWRVKGNLGATEGALRGEVVWQYTGGYSVVATPANLHQAGISAFSVFNLNFQYAPELQGWSKGLTLSLNVDNVLDTHPPLYNGVLGSAGYGYVGFTLGRLIQFGVSKKF